MERHLDDVCEHRVVGDCHGLGPPSRAARKTQKGDLYPALARSQATLHKLGMLAKTSVYELLDCRVCAGVAFWAVQNSEAVRRDASLATRLLCDLDTARV